MNQGLSNPFTSIYIRYPDEQRPDYERFCQTENQSPIDMAPFPRRVDMWFAALSIAAHDGLTPVDLSAQGTTDLVQGSIFDSDPWRIRVLTLLALSIDKSIDVVNNPARIMSIANGLAAAGQPEIVKMLTGGGDRPIWNLSEAFEELLAGDT